MSVSDECFRGVINAIVCIQILILKTTFLALKKN